MSALKGAALSPRAQLMMSAPDFFEVSYSINPWMRPDQWRAQAEDLSLDAQRGWAALKAQYEALGAAVYVQPAQRGLPDLVFTANAGFVLDRTVVPARFMHPQRQGEQAHDAAFFGELKAQGLIERMVPLPPDL
ncbi:MAG TPA: amidinotransferase, partial [Burkholderiaceae bacterium]|nr:amidinotransferase [Burkholderiaceae bacterium]